MNDVPEPFIGEIEAVRAFDITNGALTSVGLGEHVWTPGPNRARCHLAGRREGARTVWVNDVEAPYGLAKHEEEAVLSAHGPIPSPNCSCGFYVFKSESRCREEFEGGGADMIGKVRIWGRAIEHDDGYRAEFARIIALVTDDPPSVSSLLDFYEIEAAPPRTRAEEGLTTAYITTVNGRNVKLDVPTRESEEVTGWFSVAEGIEIPEPVERVSASFTPDRVITELWLEDA